MGGVPALCEKRLQINRNYITITIENVPKVQVMDEVDNNSKIKLASPIYHSWLRSEKSGIVGLKFSAWMINQSFLSKEEKAILKKWGKSNSDFEILFGDKTEYDVEKSKDDVVLFTSILKMDKTTHAISFPLFGVSVDKKEMAELEAMVPRWKSDRADAIA